jgi:hypothetical protein
MKNSQDDLEGLRFRRECAEEWRLFALSARNAQSQEVRLQMATVWETLATEIAEPTEHTVEPMRLASANSR